MTTEEFYMVTVEVDRTPATYHGTVDVEENTSAQDLYYLIMDAVYAQMCSKADIYWPDVTAVLAYHHEPSYKGAQSQHPTF